MRTLILLALLSAAQPTLRIEATPRGDVFAFKATDPGGLDSNVAAVLVTSLVNEPKSGTLVATDVDGDALAYSIVAQGVNGEAVITNSATGEFLYTPWQNVTLTKGGGDPGTLYTLQRSFDLVVWNDLTAFLPGVDSIVDRQIAPAQFYRLRVPAPAPQARTRVVPTP